MEYAMDGTQRCRKFLDMMRQASTPLSGGALSRETGVDRQVVTQGIALLRTVGYPILSTARGHVFNGPKHVPCLFKVCHTNEQTEDELVTIVDLGGTVADVMVNHRVYKKMSAPLNIKNRRNVQLFMNNIQAGESILLMNVTSGYHFHYVCAGQEEIPDKVEGVPREKHYLADLLSYEMSDNE